MQICSDKKRLCQNYCLGSPQSEVAIVNTLIREPLTVLIKNKGSKTVLWILVTFGFLFQTVFKKTSCHFLLPLSSAHFPFVNGLCHFRDT